MALHPNGDELYLTPNKHDSSFQQEHYTWFSMSHNGHLFRPLTAAGFKHVTFLLFYYITHFFFFRLSTPLSEDSVDVRFENNSDVFTGVKTMFLHIFLWWVKRVFVAVNLQSHVLREKKKKNMFSGRGKKGMNMISCDTCNVMSFIFLTALQAQFICLASTLPHMHLHAVFSLHFYEWPLTLREPNRNRNIIFVQ